MSTSGVSSFQLVRDEIIEAALRKLGVVSEGNPANTIQITTGAQALNSLMKLMATKGMPIWAIKQYTFNTIASTNTYNIGNGQTFDTPAPLKVTQATRVESPTAVNIPMNIYTQYDFNNLPITAISSPPINLYYQPLSTYGVIKLWPTPDTTVTSITITYQRPFEDVVTSTDNIDFPSYWTDAIIYNLAWRLAPEYGTPLQERTTIAGEAKMFTDEALSFGTEEGSLFFAPDNQYRR